MSFTICTNEQCSSRTSNGVPASRRFLKLV
nr:MAG TPA: hypothetical protein [Caudoviricetes sp.]